MNNKYTIEISQDDLAENPRDWENLGRIICWHHRYNLGDQHKFTCPSHFEEEAKELKHIMLPLFLYDHSGITMNTAGFSCQWDSGQVGYVYVSRIKLREEFGYQRLTKKRFTEIRGLLEREIKTYDQFLRGDVYNYSITNDSGEIIDSCGGFFGHDHCLSEAQDLVKWHIADDKKRREKRLKGYIRNRVPLEKRVFD